MCDGVTQGLPGMELSLFSRDTIAMGTAIALSHDVFDAALLLGICDKIVPGLLIGALHFGHLPCVFVPGGPMSSGMPNAEKTRVREQFALRPGRPRRADGGRVGVVPRRRAPAPSTAPPTATRCCSRRWACTCRAPPSSIRMPAARGADARGGRLVLANARWQHRPPRAKPRSCRSVASSTSARSSTPWSRCWPPAARPTT